MTFPKIILFAFFGGVILQLLFRRLPISIAVPPTALFLWILFTEVLSYKGGDKFMWNIFLFFIVIFAAVASFIGARLVSAHQDDVLPND